MRRRSGALTERPAAFEHGDGVPEISLAEVDVAEYIVGACQAVRVIAFFADPDPLLASSDALGEFPKLGQAPDPPGTRDTCPVCVL
jgi:hypothetical protein